MPRFVVKFVDDAEAEGLTIPYRSPREQSNEFCYCLYDMEAEGGPQLIATDRMEPEDALFVRDLAWVPELLNLLTEKKDV